MAHWLVKSEPSVWSWQQQVEAGAKGTFWNGVRNHVAKQHLMAMKKGEQAFFYHSNTSPPGIVGLMEVSELALVDPSQFDPASKYFDPRSKPDAPRWDCVRLRYLRTFPQVLALDALRASFADSELAVVRRGNRLSILPVSESSARRLYGLLGVEP